MSGRGSPLLGRVAILPRNLHTVSFAGHCFFLGFALSSCLLNEKTAIQKCWTVCYLTCLCPSPTASQQDRCLWSLCARKGCEEPQRINKSQDMTGSNMGINMGRGPHFLRTQAVRSVLLKSFLPDTFCAWTLHSHAVLTA